MQHRQPIAVAILLMLAPIATTAQGIMGGHVTGNVQIDGQISHRDTTIGADDVPEKLLTNARADIQYTNGDFSAGLRFEAYMNPMLGFDPQYKSGQGIANYYLSYRNADFSVTAGHFYEQFGNGMVLRSYEDRYLGLDNALFGVDIGYRPWRGIALKGLIGKQRKYWQLGDGIVRGIDAEFSINEIVGHWSDAKTRLSIGGSFVSKYEESETIESTIPGYVLNLPLNVGAGAVRMDVVRGGFVFQAEYAYKSQDPNKINDYIYKPGNALWLNASYSQKGVSANLQMKRVDNMGFKSVRSQDGDMLYINYLPSITKQHTYAFLSMYPYATQSTGEIGYQADIMYKIKKDTWLGGKYGTSLHFNASLISALDTSRIGGRGTDGYTASPLGMGDIYYGDINIEIAKKMSSNVKATATYGYIVFNPITEGHKGSLHHNHVLVGDVTWKINRKNVLRFEAEWMGSDSKYDAAVDDKRCGDWIMGLVEYNFSSAFFVSVSEQYCYNDGIGNYYNISAGYTRKATRFQIGYGKQREGIVCVGGMCRQVPASNGLTFSLTTSF